MPRQDRDFTKSLCKWLIQRVQPISSLRANHWKITAWLFVFTLGMLLLFLPGPNGSTVLSPGSLIFEHRTSSQQCTVCHTAAYKEALGWLSAAVVSDGTNDLDDSKLCLNCHQLGKHAFLAHGRPSEELAVVTERVKQMTASTVGSFSQTVSSWFRNIMQPEREQLACATCHQEHQGKDFHLADMDGQQCQACHAQQFSSLVDGHPPFWDYLPDQRLSIIFDHNSHIGKHFLGEFKEEAPTTCTACHMPDEAGRTMLVGTFQQTCANCHAKEIEGIGRANTPGISVLGLPGVDLEILHNHEISVGEWPADYNVEEGLTPFMLLLLEKEPMLADDLALLSDLDNFTDLTDASEEEVQAVGRIIWGVKELFFDLLAEGQQALTTRLQQARSLSKVPVDIAALVGQLPIEVIRAAQQHWLPNLMTEIPRYRATGSIPQSEES